MANITTKDVLKLARLARLHIEENEVDTYLRELNAIVDYFDLLNEAEIEGLEPTSQVTGLVNVFREDEVREQVVTPERLLEETPQQQDRYIKVKRMI